MTTKSESNSVNEKVCIMGSVFEYVDWFFYFVDVCRLGDVIRPQTSA